MLVSGEHPKRNRGIWTACISGTPSAPKQGFDVGMDWLIIKACVTDLKVQYVGIVMFGYTRWEKRKCPTEKKVA